MRLRAHVCGKCRQKCLQIHGGNDQEPTSDSFFKIMFGSKFSEFLHLPPHFTTRHVNLVGKMMNLEDASGRRWQVKLLNVEGALAFVEGWSKFVLDHSLTLGELLVFTYIVGSHFLVEVFGTSACEKLKFSLTEDGTSPKRKTGTSKEVKQLSCENMSSLVETKLSNDTRASKRLNLSKTENGGLHDRKRVKREEIKEATQECLPLLVKSAVSNGTRSSKRLSLSSTENGNSWVGKRVSREKFMGTSSEQVSHASKSLNLEKTYNGNHFQGKSAKSEKNIKSRVSNGTRASKWLKLSKKENANSDEGKEDRMAETTKPSCEASVSGNSNGTSIYTSTHEKLVFSEMSNGSFQKRRLPRRELSSEDIRNSDVVVPCDSSAKDSIQKSRAARNTSSPHNAYEAEMIEKSDSGKIEITKPSEHSESSRQSKRSNCKSVPEMLQLRVLSDESRMKRRMLRRREPSYQTIKAFRAVVPCDSHETEVIQITDSDSEDAKNVPSSSVGLHKLLVHQKLSDVSSGHLTSGGGDMKGTVSRRILDKEPKELQEVIDKDSSKGKGTISDSNFVMFGSKIDAGDVDKKALSTEKIFIDISSSKRTSGLLGEPCKDIAYDLSYVGKAIQIQDIPNLVQVVESKSNCDAVHSGSTSAEKRFLMTHGSRYEEIFNDSNVTCDVIVEDLIKEEANTGDVGLHKFLTHQKPSDFCSDHLISGGGDIEGTVSRRILGKEPEELQEFIDEDSSEGKVTISDSNLVMFKSNTGAGDVDKKALSTEKVFIDISSSKWTSGLLGEPCEDNALDLSYRETAIKIEDISNLVNMQMVESKSNCEETFNDANVTCDVIVEDLIKEEADTGGEGAASISFGFKTIEDNCDEEGMDPIPSKAENSLGSGGSTKGTFNGLIVPGDC